MSPEQILAQAVARAKFANQTPRNIPIRSAEKSEPIPITQPPKSVAPSEPAPIFPTIRAVVEATASYYGVAVPMIYSHSRQQFVCRVRHIVFFIASQVTGKSGSDIARHLGGRDHTTAINSIRKIERFLAEDQFLDHQIEQIKNLISARSNPTELVQA